MARIVFTSGAYLGDVAPFVEPANRLAARGHEVTFVLPINKLAWKSFARGSGAVMYDRTFNRHCEALGQEPLHGNSLLAWTRAERTVVLLSRHYFGKEPDDWPGWQLGGFSHWSGPQNRQIDPQVEDYLSEGDAPVLVCLGTSAAGAAKTFATIADGLGRASFRPLMLVGSARNLELLAGVPGTFEFAPVAAVIDRCAAAVVSGALGTLAAALTAGAPVVVLPQLFDQVWHGRRVEELGVGILVNRPDKVAGAVARLLHDPRYRERARELADLLRLEDGAGSLVTAVESTI